MVFRDTVLLFLLGLLTLSTLRAQPDKENAFIQAMIGGSAVERLIQQDSMERAEAVAQRHLNSLQELGSWDGYIQIRNILARGYLQRSDLMRLAAVSQSNLALIERYPVNPLTKAGTHFIAGATYLSLGQVDSSIHHLRISQVTFDTITDPFPVDHLPDSLSFVSNTFYPRIMKQMYAVQRPTALGKVYNYLGLAYLATLDARRSELMFAEAQQFFRESGATPLEFTAAINRGQAILQQRAGQENAEFYERAKAAFAEALSLAREAPPAFTDFYQGVASRYLAVNAMINERHPEATERYAEAVASFQSVEDIQLEQLFRVPAPFIRVSLAAENLQAALLAEPDLSAPESAARLDSLDRLEARADALEAAYGQIDQELTFGVKMALARTRLSLQDWKGAHRMLRSLLETLTNEPVAYDQPAQLPAFSDLPTARILDTKLFIAIAEAFDRQYQATNEISVRRLAYQYYRLASERLARNRTYHLGYSGGTFSSELALGQAEVYNSGVTRQLFRTGLGLPEVGAADLLAYAEAGKAVVLRNVIDGLEAFNQLPQRVRERERFYRSELSRNQALLRNASTVTVGTASTAIAEQWLGLQREYEQFVDSLKQEYPVYYQLRYDTEPFVLNRFRRKVVWENTLYLEYIMVPEEKLMYLIWFDPEQSGIKEVALPDKFFKQVEQHIRMGTVPYPEQDKALLSEYLENNNELYDILLGGVEDQMNSVERLVVVPDGILHRVDFGYLLSDSVSISVDSFIQAPDYTKLPLLIKRLSTQYVNTFSTLEQLQERNSAINASDREYLNYGGFEPSFGQPDQTIVVQVDDDDVLFREKKLGPLNSVDRVFRTLVDPRSLWKSENATKANFLTAIDQYSFGVLHISTHGVLHPTDPLGSFLLWEFLPTNAAKTRISLTARELYNLSIQADLVLVNSCNSGSSSMSSVSSEGLLSIGRAFFFAGCSSLILGRWAMSSEATDKITVNMMERLQRSEPISRALQSAKLDYLENEEISPFAKSPYFWAALSHWGKDAVLFR